MRYFLINFSVQGTPSTGSILLQHEGFPSRTFLLIKVNELAGKEYKDIIIHNIYEFKTEEDYEEFKT